MTGNGFDVETATAMKRTGIITFAFAMHLAIASPCMASAQVTIGYENNGADPYMVTQSLGLFGKMMKDNVRLVEFNSGPAAMGALASGSLQLMCGIGMPPVVSALSQGLPLTIIFNQERYTADAGIVVRPGAGITTIADLKGKKIAIVQGSQATFELATFLAGAGMAFNSVDQVNMSPPEMRAAWNSNSIDAAIVWDPVFDALQDMGATVLKTDADLPAGASSYNICIADKNWVDAHPAETIGFIKALDAGVSYTQAHHASAIALMANAAGIDTATAEAELKGYQIYNAKDQASPAVLGSGSAVAQSATGQTLRNTAAVLLAIGRITAPLSDVNGAIEPRFAIGAAK
jgi:NitT/TauT family transport system substrate-binding protein/taurine transport system substrate-binding protein